jgi:glycosyltransferase involved in cell wall biosynthesis
MQRDPTVSVIVCFLNEERFLGEAVASVLAQTFADWELLLVDDGSTDGSSGIARDLAASEPDRVRYLDHDGHRNLGLSASRNAGIARARGRYIAFLDADDSWYPGKLHEQVEILDRHPQAAMVIGASTYWRSWAGQSEGVDEIIPIGAEQDAVIAPPELMTRLYPLGAGATPPPSDILARCDAVRAVGGFEASFRGPLMLYEDQAFLSKICRRYPVYVASACWDRYRLRADSIVATQRAAQRYWQVRSHFLHWLRRDLARTGGAPAQVQPTLDRAIREARVQVALVRMASVARRILPTSLIEQLRRLRRYWPATR